MEKERRIYLVRHGELYEADGLHRCLGHTDVPLTTRGQRQAEKIAEWFPDKGIKKIYSSPLQRCVKTAQAIKARLAKAGQFPGLVIREDLRELDAGIWENLSFQEIRERYPREYQERGERLGSYAPPGGESFVEAGERFGRCLEQLRMETDGALLVVAHAGVIRGYLTKILGIPEDAVFTIPQPYAGVTVFKENAAGFRPEKIGWRPLKFLDDEEFSYLYRKCNTSERTIRHMEKVAGYLESLAEELELPGAVRERLKKAALVHDICRAQKKHAAAGAEVLRKEGYEEIAGLVAVHHGEDFISKAGPDEEKKLSEEELLFYADKCVQEDQIVPVEERFKKSLEKCHSSEAVEAHGRQYQKAREIERKIMRAGARLAVQTGYKRQEGTK